MSRKYILVFIVLQISCCISYSQDSYQKGFYVDTKGDTVRGFILEKEWDKNPLEFTFKKQLDQIEGQKIRSSEASSFSVDDGAIFQSHFVAISMNDVNLNRTSPLKPDAKIDTVFLKMLGNGNYLSLYYHKDGLKERFFIKEINESTPQELIYEIEKLPNGNKRLRETYKQQLYTMAAKAGKLTPEFERKLKQAPYGIKSLTGIVNIINGNTDKIANSSSGGRSQLAINFYGGAGISITDLIYKGGSEWIKSNETSYNPYFLLGMKFSPHVRAGRFAFCTEVSINTASFKTVANNSISYVPQQIVSTFNQSNTGLTLVVDYNLIKTEKIKYYVGAGIRGNLTTYSNNLTTVTETYPTYINTATVSDFFNLKNYISFSLRTGLHFSKRMESVVEYNSGLSYLGNSDGLWTITMVGVRLGLNYHFK